MGFNFLGENLLLMPEKAIYWPVQKTLLLADIHLGKVSHFRKAGIPVPIRASVQNLEVITQLIQSLKPERVIFLGDLFHSSYNEEWESFKTLLSAFESISFELIIGNHDVLSQYQYERTNLVVREELRLGPFLLTHHPLEEIKAELYNLAGHVHPGVRLSGKGRQHLVLPCFYFGKTGGILPAFGSFTGLSVIQPKLEDHVFVIADNAVIKV